MFRPMKPVTIAHRRAERAKFRRERSIDLRRRLAARAASGDDIYQEMLEEFNRNHPELKEES